MPNNATLDAIFAHVDAHREEYLEGLKRLVRQPSISAQGVGVKECAELLRGIVEEAGLSARIVPTPGSPVVLGSSAVDPALPTVLIYGHYDVQPPEPLERWISPPFEPTVRDGRLWGRGVGDNKGQLFAQLMGIRSTLAVAGKLPVNVKCIFDGEEETSSLNLPGFIESHREELRADLAYTSDGPIHDSGRPSIVLGVRGILTFELVARGANRDVHSGNFGGVVPNPVWRLIDLLRTMRDENGNVLIEGFYDKVRPLTPAERTAIGKMPVEAEKVKRELALADFDRPAEIPYYERLVARPTFNICGFHGGYGGRGTKTIIPNEAVCKIDMRLVADQTGPDIFERVKRHVERHAPDVEVVYEGYMAPSKTAIEHPYVAAVERAVRRAWGAEPVIMPALGGSLPDYVFTQTLGIPSIIVPYANPDESNHAPNENLDLNCFNNGIKTCAAVLQSVAETGKVG